MNPSNPIDQSHPSIQTTTNHPHPAWQNRPIMFIRFFSRPPIMNQGVGGVVRGRKAHKEEEKKARRNGKGLFSPLIAVSMWREEEEEEEKGEEKECRMGEKWEEIGEEGGIRERGGKGEGWSVVVTLLLYIFSLSLSLSLSLSKLASTVWKNNKKYPGGVGIYTRLTHTHVRLHLCMCGVEYNAQCMFLHSTDTRAHTHIFLHTHTHTDLNVRWRQAGYIFFLTYNYCSLASNFNVKK